MNLLKNLQKLYLFFINLNLCDFIHKLQVKRVLLNSGLYLKVLGRIGESLICKASLMLHTFHSWVNQMYRTTEFLRPKNIFQNWERFKKSCNWNIFMNFEILLTSLTHWGKRCYILNLANKNMNKMKNLKRHAVLMLSFILCFHPLLHFNNWYFYYWKNFQVNLHEKYNE